MSAFVVPSRALTAGRLFLFASVFALQFACEGTIGSTGAIDRDASIHRAADGALIDDDARVTPDLDGSALDDATALDEDATASATDGGGRRDATSRDASPPDSGRHPDATVPDALPFDTGGPPPPGALPVTITMKEVSGAGAVSFPVSVVVPLPEGQFQDTSTLRITTSTGAVVPAQFEVLNRHWAKDGSIRHVLAHLQTTVAAARTRAYRLDAAGGNALPSSPATITETPSAIVLDTGALTVTIDRSPFRIHTPAGDLTATLTDPQGGLEPSFDANNITVAIEERGPMRVVVRAEAPAIKGAASTHHGWAIRLYAYAGSRDLKVDYQLQNSPKNDVFNGPMFFDSLVLAIDTGVPQPAQSYRAENITVDPLTLPPTALVAGDVTAVIRRFNEMWPNGLSVDPTGKISVELFPEWSQRRYLGLPSPTGLHWLDDMQQVVKEVLFHFGPLDATAASELARNFDLHPVGTLPVSWYADTHVTLDLGGLFPARTKAPGPERLKPDYTTYNRNTFTLAERFGWDSFALDLSRKEGPNLAGGWPYSVSQYFVTEAPADYYAGEDFAMADLNIRPQWIAQYDYARDYALLQPSENPYGSWSWRKFDGVAGYMPPDGYLPGSGLETKPRDDEHAWFYQNEEAYYISGNPWIRDYYQFIGQFRRTRLHQQDPYPDMGARAIGHALSHALQAYRVTGDVALLNLVGDYLRLYIRPIVSPTIGGFTDRPNEAVFQIGYLCHAIITYLGEIPGHDQIAIDLLGGFVSWNMLHANWGYYVALNDVNLVSHETAMSFADEQVWYGVFTSNRNVIDHANQYQRTGFGGGPRSSLDLTVWQGDFIGRVTAPVLAHWP